jgi:type IV pilus assembly protein PilE
MTDGRAPRGFTLIEVVITMAVVAILTALAIPQYSEFVARSKRTDARGQLSLAAQWMERFRAENGGVYTGAVLPAEMSRSPAAGTAAYTLSASTVAAANWTVTAAPASGGGMTSDACGSFTLDSTGQRTAAGASSGALFDRCWGR